MEIWAFMSARSVWRETVEPSTTMLSVTLATWRRASMRRRVLASMPTPLWTTERKAVEEMVSL